MLHYVVGRQISQGKFYVDVWLNVISVTRGGGGCNFSRKKCCNVTFDWLLTLLRQIFI